MGAIICDEWVEFIRTEYTLNSIYVEGGYNEMSLKSHKRPTGMVFEVDSLIKNY